MCVSFPVRNLFDVLCRCLYVLGCSAANELARNAECVAECVAVCDTVCVAECVAVCDIVCVLVLVANDTRQ